MPVIKWNIYLLVSLSGDMTIKKASSDSPNRDKRFEQLYCNREITMHNIRQIRMHRNWEPKCTENGNHDAQFKNDIRWLKPGENDCTSYQIHCVLRATN